MTRQAARWRIQPAQRGRDGFLPFESAVPPSVSEMGFDKLTVTINGRVDFAEPQAATSDEREGVAQERLFDAYHDMLCQRAGAERNWKLPSLGKHFFSTCLPKGYGTITSAKFRTDWQVDGLTVRLTISLNPTRTLIHAFSMVRSEADPLAALASLPVDQFFARSPEVPTDKFTLDGSDNAFRRVDDLVAGLGQDFAENFIRIFESKLKEWALDAVAPLSQGFVHGVSEIEPTGHGPLQRVALAWPRLYLNNAEVYFERRHGAAPDLLERSLTSLAAAQSDVIQRRYGSDLSMGRERGCATVMVKQSATRQLAVYAKTPSRLRIETRFRSNIKGNLRQTPVSAVQPITDTLGRLREIALRDLRWTELCDILSEPVAPAPADLARLVVQIVRCCNRIADPEQVLGELLAHSSIVETNQLGRFPPPLIGRLERAGIIQTHGVIARRRPGAERRHYLAEPHATVVRAAAKGFEIDEALTPASRQRPALMAVPDPHASE